MIKEERNRELMRGEDERTRRRVRKREREREKEEKKGRWRKWKRIGRKGYGEKERKN